MANEFGNAFAGMQQTLQRGREATRKENAYNAFHAAYGGVASDPGELLQLQQYEQNKTNAPLATERLKIANQAAQQGIDLSNTREAEQRRKTNAGGLLSGALYIQNALQRDPNADVGQLFDRIAPVLELPPEAAAQVRQQLVADPGAAGDLITAFRIKQGAEKGDPAAVQEYQYYNSLPDSEKAGYLQLKRANATPAIAGQTAAAQTDARNASNLNYANPIATEKAKGAALGKAEGDKAASDLPLSKTEKIKAEATLKDAEASGNVIVRELTKAKSEVSRLSAGVAAYVPLNVYNANLAQRIQGATANLVLDYVAKLKGLNDIVASSGSNGSTGFGSLVTQEENLMRDRYGSLDTHQTPSQLREQLGNVIEEQKKSWARVHDAYIKIFKAREQPAKEPATSGGSRTEGDNVILKWNPEKGDFE